jgi:hypothetical protein
MKILIFLISFWSVADFAGPEVTQLRTMYKQSAKDKESAEDFLAKLNGVNDKSAPVLVAYKGVAQIVQAKYMFNPINQLSTFKKGKALIERAVAADPGNVEVRYLRFTIQTNAPSFLGYNEHIDADKKVLVDNFPKLTDAQLKQMVHNYINKTTYSTAEDKKRVAM